MAVRESGEDYLKAILAIGRERGFVRAVDVAGRLGVSKPSVSKALVGLAREGCVEVVAHEVRLTERGRAMAERMRERHEFFRALLVGCGVNAMVADEEACRLEHCLSDESFRRLARAVVQAGPSPDAAAAARTAEALCEPGGVPGGQGARS